MTAPTHTPIPLLTLKAEEYDYQTVSYQICDALEKNPRREWDIYLVRGAVKKYAPSPLGRSDLALIFSTTYRSIATIWTTSVFLVTLFC